MKASQKRWQFIWALGRKSFREKAQKTIQEEKNIKAQKLWNTWQLEFVERRSWKGGWRAQCGCCLGTALDFIAP